MAEKKFYNVNEVRDILGVSDGGVYKWIKEGKIPAVKFGRRVMIPASFITNLEETAAAFPVVKV